jgi:hypothetical protein
MGPFSLALIGDAPYGLAQAAYYESFKNLVDEVKVGVDPNSDEVFSFHQQIIPAN